MKGFGNMGGNMGDMMKQMQKQAATMQKKWKKSSESLKSVLSKLLPVEVWLPYR